MKILNEVLGVVPTGIYLSGGSPYKSRFEPIVYALLESGITAKWDAAYFPKVQFRQTQIERFEHERSSSTKGLRLMVILLLTGYLCSFSAFASELFSKKYFDTQN